MLYVEQGRWIVTGEPQKASPIDIGLGQIGYQLNGLIQIQQRVF